MYPQTMLALIMIGGMLPTEAVAQSTSPSPPAVRPIPRAPAVTPPPRMNVRRVPGLLDIVARDDPQAITQGYLATQNFARCAGKENAEMGRDLLSADVGGANERKAVNRLMDRYRRCLPKSQAVMVGLLRGAVAEQSVRNIFVAPTSGDFLETDRYHLFLAEVPQAGEGATTALMSVVEAARCQSVLAPDQVRAVLNTDVGSAGEREAIDTVFKKAPMCGGSERPRSVSSVMHRAILAEAFYHWVRSDLTPRRNAAVARITYHA